MAAWGKRGRDAPIDAPELSLIGHCADVAAVFEALCALPTIGSRLSRLAGRPLTDVDIARLSCFAFWHDIGKASVGFWSRRFDAATARAIRQQAKLEISETGHTSVVATLLNNRELRARFFELLDFQTLNRWFEGRSSLTLFWAAISHHGSPLYCDPADVSCRVGIDQRFMALKGAWQPLDGYDPMDEIAAMAQAARLWFPLAFDENAPPTPQNPTFVSAFAGLVSLADWIASNPGPSFFPYGLEPEGDRMAFARPRARNVLKAMSVDASDARNALAARSLDFAAVFGFPPTPVQAAMAEPDLGPVVVLESETGSGKTEAALWRFAQLFRAGEVDSLAFLLPTRVAATALKGRIEVFLKKLFETDRPPLNCVLGVPGYTYADGEEAERLAPFETLWPDSPHDDAAHRRWASEHPKRCFAAAVMIGTIDQALLGGLRVRHAHMRGAALLRALLVVDEVHASDAYMTGLLEEVLSRHVKAGGHALLLSATLAGAARAKLVAAGQKRKRVRPGQVASKAADYTDAPYPAISDDRGVRVAPEPPAGRTIRPEVWRAIDDTIAIATRAALAARAGARVLVIRNTVNTAIVVQEALDDQCSDTPHLLFSVEATRALHHGRYAAEDRRLLDAAVEAALGKAALRPHGLVVVGTQTLEQSLDIDADLLITDIAPADVLLQRFGRLHRHRHPDRPPRPDGFEHARAFVMAPAEDLSAFLKSRSGRPSHGLGTVYKNLPSVRATLEELGERAEIAVPRDCRALVEAAVDPERLRMKCELWAGDWPKAWQDAIGNIRAQSIAADQSKLDWTSEWPDQGFPRYDEEKLKTRLGADDRLVDLPLPCTSPFGVTLTRMKLPGWMLSGLDADVLASDAPAEIIAEERGRLTFRWAGREFVYDNLGLQRAPK